MVSFVKCLLVASDVGSDDNDDVGENVSEKVNPRCFKFVSLIPCRLIKFSIW